MKQILRYIWISALLISSGWAFLSFGMGKGFDEYASGWEYRQLHPELLPSPIMVQLFDMGHTTAYASFKWIQLIQFIANNISGDQFLDFTHTLIEHITTLHPYFSKAYEVDLIFSPLIRGENLPPEIKAKNKAYITDAITLGKKGVSILCDSQKIKKIIPLEISESLWKRDDLRNPCPNGTGMLPYYIGFAIYQSEDQKSEASLYYKIASMNDDGPEASKMLSIIAKAGDGDHTASALNLFLIGSTGYDRAPFMCQSVARQLSAIVQSNLPIDLQRVTELETLEKGMIDTRDEKNPASIVNTNCYAMTTRGIRELYLQYITEVTKDTPVTTGDELIKLGLIPSIPRLHTDTSRITVIKQNNIWQYKEKVK